MSKWFTLQELLKSDTATRKRIDNTPSWEIVANLARLASFLDNLREAWGSGIRVTSGYRCPQLNAAVGGVSNSAHQYGNAADIVPVNGKMNEFEAFLRKWVVGKKWDQIIYETSKSSGARWIHISLYNGKGEQRCKLFGMIAA